MSIKIVAMAAAAAVVLPAGPAAAAGRHHAHPVPTAGEAGTVRPATVLGRLAPARVRLSLPKDRKVDVAAMRGTHVARRSAARRLRAVMPADRSVGARVLLLGATGTEPVFAWWKSMLAAEGVPFDAVITANSGPVTADMLQTSPTTGRYQGIVLASGSLTDCAYGACSTAMTSEAWTALQNYERDFAVREIAGYGWPSPAYGADWSKTVCGNLSGASMTVTAAGRSVFSDLAGTFEADRGVWGCEMTGLEGSSFTPLVRGPQGATVATFTRTDGVETLFNSVDGSDWAIHSKLLFHGMLRWVTKGVYLGAYRNYLGIDVDDVFLGNDRWNPATKSNSTDPASVIRMTAADVDRAVAWEGRTGVSLNLLFNGDGADSAFTGKGKTKTANDPLTQALVANRSAFRWTSHTFTHANLDTATQAQIEDEIRQNVSFASRNKLPGFNRAELTTGQHSGLDNPAMAAALTATGVRSIGSDISRANSAGAVGTASKLPRWPTGVYYNVATRGEQLDEYNHLNYEVCKNDSANLGCLKAPVDWDGYVGNEAVMIVRHLLSNDPRPHYVHQSNLAGDGTLYPVFDEVLRRYRSYVTTPLVQPSYSDAVAMLNQQAAWRSALERGAVSGTISATGLTITSASPVAVPLTGTSVGGLYGGVRSGWTSVAAGTTSVGL